ncbi:MAG: DegT/DnrJ/EryC1/StrS family aminotransferase [Deltaproteobacteria bacterium]|nr:DegT/DnrJ/EryC1/StrS family aminotransferase [Deltaproteobacteria bacterium]
MTERDEIGIPLLDLQAQNGPLREPIREAIERVVASNRFILGPEVRAFEEEIKRYIGVEHAIGVSSGTDALLVALMALNIGRNDEVVTTPFSFFATAGAIARLGAVPVFVDIDPLSFNLDLDQLEAAITAHTKAILPVHLFGQTCDLERLSRVSEQSGIPVVEDAAQAIGAKGGALFAGAVGAFGCFSFFPSKNLGAFGDAGLVTTNDAALARRVRILRAHGAEPKYHHALIGGNFRLDELQAAILRVKLPYLNQWTEARRKNAARYNRLFRQANLPEPVLKTPAATADGHIYNQYVIRTNRRDALRDYLLQQHIGCEIYYPKPLHLQACFGYLGYTEGRFIQAERAAAELLALPVFPELGESRVDQVAERVIGFLKRR